MGFLRKLTIISTGGLAPIKGESYRERTAKAAEKQVKLQKQMLAAQQPAAATPADAALRSVLANCVRGAEATFADCSVARLGAAAQHAVGDLGYSPRPAAIGKARIVSFRKPLTIWCRARDMGIVVMPEGAGVRALVVAQPIPQLTDSGESRKIARKLLARVSETLSMTPEPTPEPPSVPIPMVGSATAESITGEMERLAVLHTQGALSDDEFAAAKARVLGT